MVDSEPRFSEVKESTTSLVREDEVDAPAPIIINESQMLPSQFSSVATMIASSNRLSNESENSHHPTMNTSAITTPVSAEEGYYQVSPLALRAALERLNKNRSDSN